MAAGKGKPVGKIGKGVRVRGATRGDLATRTAQLYEQGSSVRELAQKYGRSYGFVHRLLTESGTVMRARGGDNHRPT